MINADKCKPLREFVLTFGSQEVSCFIRFDSRQIWAFSRIGSDQVEVWRDNVSVRMETERFERYFRRV